MSQWLGYAEQLEEDCTRKIQTKQFSNRPALAVLFAILLLNDLILRWFAVVRISEVLRHAEKTVYGLQQSFEYSRRTYIRTHETAWHFLRSPDHHTGPAAGLGHMDHFPIAVAEREDIRPDIALVWLGQAARCAIITGLKALGVDFPADCIIMDTVGMKESCRNEVMNPVVMDRYFFGQRDIFLRLLDYAISKHFLLTRKDKAGLGHIYEREYFIALLSVKVHLST